MQYRRFGRTELPMPVLSCGGMRYQHKWQDQPWEEIPADNQHNLEATIRRALDFGITHIETARGYGTSEMQLGRILPHLPREQLIVQTKVGPRPEARQFQELFNRSLSQLNLEYVDLLGIHGINTWDRLHDSLKPGGCLDLVQTWIRQGRVRHVGFSTHGPLDVILAAIHSGRFDYINLHWYYINQTNWPAIEAAQAEDMGVFIISPSDKGGKLYSPPQKLVDLCAPLSPMVFNDLFCLCHPQVHTLSLGAARPSDFDEHLKVLPLLDQADTLLPPILARLHQALVAQLGESYAKTWQEGLPTYDKTPGQVNIPMILRLYHLATSFDMVDFARERYSLLGNGDHWFPGQQVTQAHPQALATALQHSPHRDQILDILSQAHQLLGGSERKRLSQS